MIEVLQDDVVAFQTHAQLRKLSPREDWEQCEWGDRAGSEMMQDVKEKAIASYESVKVVGAVKLSLSFVRARAPTSLSRKGRLT